MVIGRARDDKVGARVVVEWRAQTQTEACRPARNHTAPTHRTLAAVMIFHFVLLKRVAACVACERDHRCSGFF